MPDARETRPDEPVRDGELPGLFSEVLTFPAALAVSGGADSIALLHLVHRWRRLRDMRPAAGGAPESVIVLTIDHGLRAESADEARWVAGLSRALGFRHETLIWTGEKPASGIQDAARKARYALLRAFVASEGAGRAVATAHHQDDQAETLLMRLARGSGVDGLAGMRPRSTVNGLTILRPLLGVPKSRLVATLRAAGQAWIEDPSNEATRFERVRWRNAAPALGELGLAPEPLAASARRLARASDALEMAAHELAARAGLDVHGGAYASLDLVIFRAGAEELRIRVLRRLLAAFGGRAEPPSLSGIEELSRRIQAGPDTSTLWGAIAAAAEGGRLEVFREMGHGGPPEIEISPGETLLWDRRFEVGLARGCTSTVLSPVTVGALGDAGLRQLLDAGWRSVGLLPRRAAITLPAFRASGRLLAVPGAGFCDPAEDPRRYSAIFVGDPPAVWPNS